MARASAQHMSLGQGRSALAKVCGAWAGGGRVRLASALAVGVAAAVWGSACTPDDHEAVATTGPTRPEPPCECLAERGHVAPSTTGPSDPVAGPVAPHTDDAREGPRSELLRDRLEETRGPMAMGRGLLSAVLVARFYEGRGYRPAWTSDRELAQASQLVDALPGLEGHGLVPEHYHLASLRAALERVEDAPDDDEAAVALDLLLTDAFLTAGSHLAHGRVDPKTIHHAWTAARRDVDVAAALEASLAKPALDEVLFGLAPSHAAYRGLVGALREHQRIAAQGGWKKVRPEHVLEKKKRDPAVAALRERLVHSGDLDDPGDPTRAFDDALAAALQRFQARHGLRPTDVLDPSDHDTLTALNAPVDFRVRQIEANLERWRWLRDDLGERHLRVNIAGYTLQGWERGRVVLQMRVIVGRQYRQTPVFSDAVTHIVVHPRWSVPHKLATRDILPKVVEDLRYLAQRGIRVYSLRGGVEREVDPSSVPWERLGPRDFPYKLRQAAGPDNALGRLKFMFPNDHGVYLHDTPTRDLFGWSHRDQSSGCIRVEDPLGLAAFILANDPKWDHAALERALARELEETIWPSRPIPIHILYETVWLDDHGVLQVRRDLYGRDRALGLALRRAPADAPEITASAALARPLERDTLSDR